MREIRLKLEDIVPKNQLEEYKEKEGIQGDLEWHWDENNRNFVVSEAGESECEKHECRLMFDDSNREYYCPICES